MNPQSDRHFCPMKNRYWSRAAVYAGVFLAAGLAGWQGARISRQEVPPATGTASGRQEPDHQQAVEAIGRPQQPELIRMERELLDLVDPEKLKYDGAQLESLCSEEYPTDLPGAPKAVVYAEQWAEAAPEEMFAWFQARGDFSVQVVRNGRVLHGMNLLPNLFNGWARSDPDRAAGAALACPRKTQRIPAMAAVIAELKRSDPAKAAALAATHAGLLAESNGTPFSGYGAEAEPNLKLLQSLPESAAKSKLLAGFFEEAVRYQGSKAVTYWEAMPEEARRQLVEGGFSGMHLNDGQEMFPPTDPPLPDLAGLRDLLFKKAEGGTPEDAQVYLHKYGNQWAGEDPSAALSWAWTHLRGEQRLRQVSSLYAPAAAGNLEEALAAWELLPPGTMKAKAAGAMAAGAPAGRVAEVEALIAALPPADQQAAVLAQQAATQNQTKRRNR